MPLAGDVETIIGGRRRKAVHGQALQHSARNGGRFKREAQVKQLRGGHQSKPGAGTDNRRRGGRHRFLTRQRDTGNQGRHGRVRDIQVQVGNVVVAVEPDLPDRAGHGRRPAEVKGDGESVTIERRARE